MIDVKKFVYDKLRENATLVSKVSDRIYPNRMSQGNKDWPIIIHSRIAPGKIDIKGIRNEYIQVSVW